METFRKGIIAVKKKKKIYISPYINHFYFTHLDTLQSLGAFGSCWTVKRTLLWRRGKGYRDYKNKVKTD